MPLKVGLLDFCSISLQHTIDAAGMAEAAGYHRYWLAEHADHSVHSSSLMVAALLAASTERIRVGATGPLIRMQSPLQVANDAALLAGMFPRRIDLGLAGGGAAPEVMDFLGLASQSPREQYEQRCQAVFGLLRGELPVKTSPRVKTPPQLWQLVTGARGAQLASGFGVRLCLSLLHTPERPSPDLLKAYREQMAERFASHAATTSIAVSVACASTEEEAHQLPARRSDLAITWRVLGTPAQCAEQLHALVEEYSADELIILEGSPSAPRAVEIQQALARALQLDPAA